MGKAEFDQFLGALTGVGPRLQAMRTGQIDEATKRAALETSPQYVAASQIDPRISQAAGLPYSMTTPGASLRPEDTAALNFFGPTGFIDPQTGKYVGTDTSTYHPLVHPTLAPSVVTPDVAHSWLAQQQGRATELGAEFWNRFLNSGQQGGQWPGGIPPSGWTVRGPGGISITGGTEHVSEQPVPPPSTPGPVGGQGGIGRDQPRPPRGLTSSGPASVLKPGERYNVTDLNGEEGWMIPRDDGVTVDTSWGPGTFDSNSGKLTLHPAQQPATPSSPAPTAPPPAVPKATPAPGGPQGPPPQSQPLPGTPQGQPQPAPGTVLAAPPPASAAPAPTPAPGAPSAPAQGTGTGPAPGPSAPPAPTASAPQAQPQAAPAGQPTPNDVAAAKDRLLRLHPGNQIPGQAPGAGGALGPAPAAPPSQGAPLGLSAPQPEAGGAAGYPPPAFIQPGDTGATVTPTGARPTPPSTTAAPPPTAPGAPGQAPGLTSAPVGDPGEAYRDIIAATKDPDFQAFEQTLMGRYKEAQAAGTIGAVDPGKLLRDPEAVAMGRMYHSMKALEEVANKAGISAEIKEQAQRDLARDELEVVKNWYTRPIGIDTQTGKAITALSTSNPSVPWAYVGAFAQKLHSWHFLHGLGDLVETAGPGGLIPPGGLSYRAKQPGPFGQAAEQMLMSPVLAIPVARAYGTSGRINQTELNRIQDYVLPNADNNFAENKNRYNNLINSLEAISRGSGSEGMNQIRQRYGLGPVGSGDVRSIGRQPQQDRSISP